MDGPREMKEDDVVVDGGRQTQRQNIQNTTPLFLQHCFYFGNRTHSCVIKVEVSVEFLYKKDYIFNNIL